MNQQELKERALELNIWNHDRLATKDLLGGVRLNLGTGNPMIAAHPIDCRWREYLKKKKNPGNLLYSLREPINHFKEILGLIHKTKRK